MKRVKRFVQPVVVLGLLIVLFCYGMFQGGFVSWFLFYSFSPFALYALLLALYPVNQFHVIRSMNKQEFFHGDRLEVQLQIIRTTRFPLFFLLVEDRLPDSLKGLYQAKTKAILFLNIKHQVSFSYELTGVPRGEHCFGPIRLKLSDPLGLLEKEMEVAVLDRVIVYPRYEKLTLPPFQTQIEQGYVPSRHQLYRDVTMVSGIRDYQPGDRFSLINWKVTAKQNEMMVKEFEQQLSANDVMFVLDCTANERFEAAVSLAASLANSLLYAGVQGGLLAVGEKRIFSPLNSGEKQFKRILNHLAVVRENQHASFHHVLESERPVLQGNMTLILITALFSHEVVNATHYYLQKNHHMHVFIVKEAEEAINEKEKLAIAKASAKGIKVKILQHHHFKDGLMGVASYD